MGVAGVALWYIQSAYSDNNNYTFTHDIEIAPSNIGATAFANYLQFSGDPNYFFVGISEYRTRNANGQDTVHTFGGGAQSVAPCMFANPCDSVTFTIGLGGPSVVALSVVMQLFFFG